MHIPEPIPPIALLSIDVNPVAAAGAWGAMLGKYKQPNPSADISNSTNGGNMQEVCALKSFGVVIDTSVFTLVKGTGPPPASVEPKGKQHNGLPSLKKLRRSIGSTACAANLSNMY